MYAKISSPSRPASQAFTTASTSSRAISLWISLSCFPSLVVARPQLELGGTIGRSAHPPLLELRVVFLGLGELDEMADRVGDDDVVGLQESVVLREVPRQRRRDVPSDRGFLCDDERLDTRDTIAQVG